MARIQGPGSPTRKPRKKEQSIGTASTGRPGMKPAPKRIKGRGRIRPLEMAKQGPLMRRQSRAQQEPANAGKTSNRARLQGGKPKRFQMRLSLKPKAETSHQFSPSTKLDPTQVRDRRLGSPLRIPRRDPVNSALGDLAGGVGNILSSPIRAVARLGAENTAKRARAKLLKAKAGGKLKRVVRGTYKKHPKRGGK